MSFKINFNSLQKYSSLVDPKDSLLESSHCVSRFKGKQLSSCLTKHPWIQANFFIKEDQYSKNSCFDRLIQPNEKALKTATFQSKEQLVNHLYHLQLKVGEKALEPQITRKGIEQSLNPQNDFKTRLNLGQDLPQDLELHVSLCRNSFANGYRYLDFDKGILNKIEVRDAITSSFNRVEKERIAVLRLIEDQDKDPICYAGRPSTYSKTLELAKAIYLREKDSNRGIKNISQEVGKPPLFEVTFLVNSVLSTSSLLSAKEKKVAEEELEALQLLAQNDISFIDPDTQEALNLRFNPLFLNDQFNFMNRIEKVLPEHISGEEKSRKLSQMGKDKLECMILEKLDEWRNEEDTERFKLLDSVYQVYQHILELTAEEKFCIYDFIGHLLDIPLVKHCASSTDRSSILIAFSAAVKTWIKKGWSVEKEGKLAPHLILDDPKFKELFFAYCQTGNLIAEISRGEKGLKWEGGSLMENPALARCLPERFLKDFSFGDLKTSEKALLGPLLITRAIFDVKMREPLKDWVKDGKGPAQRVLRKVAIGLGAIGGVLEFPFVFAATSAIEVSSGIKKTCKKEDSEKPPYEKRVKLFKFFENFSTLFPKKVIDKSVLKQNDHADLLFQK